MSIKLSVIIPIYNEESTLEIIIERIRSMTLPPAVTSEIILVDDGSTDGTAQIIKKYQHDPAFVLLSNPQNAGKTEAIRTGLRHASGSHIIIQDADREYDPHQIPQLLEPILQGKTEIVYGSRFLGTIEGMLLKNRLANIASNITFNLLFATKLTDINTCYKIFKKSLIREQAIKSQGFGFETEITARFIRRKYTIIELPINYRARTYRQGKKINWLKALEMYWGIFYFRFAK